MQVSTKFQVSLDKILQNRLKKKIKRKEKERREERKEKGKKKKSSLFNNLKVTLSDALYKVQDEVIPTFSIHFLVIVANT